MKFYIISKEPKIIFGKECGSHRICKIEFDARWNLRLAKAWNPKEYKGYKVYEVDAKLKFRRVK